MSDLPAGGLVAAASAPNATNTNENDQLFFPFAPQPDVVRASQKDEYYKKLLFDKYFDLIRYYLGPRTALSSQDEVRLASDLSYYSLTTLIGRQTLGEEYCDVMQVQGSRMTSPYFLERVLLLFWQVIVPYSVHKLSTNITKISRSASPSTTGLGRYLTESRRQFLTRWLPRVKDIADIMQRVHLAFFYFSGVFYHISKRLSNVRYILDHKLDERRPRYHVLGGLIMIQLVVSLLIFLKEYFASRQSALLQAAEAEKLKAGEVQANESAAAEFDDASSTGKCSLCLGSRTHPTATACGHLFCWTCITEWCNNKSECPLCRTPQKKTDLVVIYNI